MSEIAGTFQSLIVGLIDVFQPTALCYMLLGIAIGFVVGILPGLGSGTALVLMFPFIFRMPPVQAFAFLLGMASVVATTGDLTSILFGVPGESDCVASIFDGHPLAKQGQAGRAMAASLMSSLMGAIFGGLVLAVGIPLVRPLVLAFGSPGLFMAGVLGLTFVATLSEADVLKGLLGGCLGLLVAMVGLEGVTGTPRFTFGLYYLWDGVSLIPVTLGLFAIPEIIDLAIKGGAISKTGVTEITGVMDGIKDSFRHWKLVLRCSGIGAFMSLIPGIGSGTSQYIAYAHAVQSSPDKERFGKGAIEGVLGPGAANNAKEGGALIPAIAFGVPSGMHSALLLGAFTILGLTPGLAMLRPEQNLHVTYSLVWTIIVANLITVPLCFVLLKHLALLTQIRGTILIPVLLMLVYIGGFVTNTFGDMVLVLLFSALGWLMVTFGWLRSPLLIGLVLGKILEKNLFISVDAYGGFSWLQRPVVMILIIVTLAGIIFPIYKSYKNNAKQERKVQPLWKLKFSYGALFSLGMLLLFAITLWVAKDWSPRARVFPFVIFIPALILAIANLIKDLGWQPWTETIKETIIEAGIDSALFRKRTIETFAWILGFFAAIWGFGFPIGVTLATFIYLKFFSRERWILTTLVTLGAWVFVGVLFGQYLHYTFPDGELFNIFDRIHG